MAFRITLYLQGTVSSFPKANLFAKTGTKSQSLTSSKTSGPKISEDFGFDFYFVPWGYYLCGLGYCGYGELALSFKKLSLKSDECKIMASQCIYSILVWPIMLYHASLLYFPHSVTNNYVLK